MAEVATVGGATVVALAAMEEVAMAVAREVVAKATAVVERVMAAAATAAAKVVAAAARAAAVEGRGGEFGGRSSSLGPSS